MNIEEIDKWLDNEYGTSYTRLEELHDYFFEKYTDQKEEIERLNNIIKEVRENIDKKLNINSDYVDYDYGTELLRQELLEILDKEKR